MESRTQRSKPRPMIQKNPRPRPRTGFSKPRTGMLKAKDTKRRCSPKRKKRFSREEIPISRVKKKSSWSWPSFNNSMFSAENRAFSRTCRLQGQGFDLRGKSQGLQNVSSRTPPLLVEIPTGDFQRKNCSANVAFSQIT